jgi:hypothetical protein
MIKQAFKEYAGYQSEDEGFSDEDEDSPPTITSLEFTKFLNRNFDLNDYSRGTFNMGPIKTQRRIKNMIESIFVIGLGQNAEKLTMRELASGFRERIELRLPLAAFFHVGINACCIVENKENQFLEKVY